MKKKIMAIMLALAAVLALGLTACGDKTPAGSPSAPQNFTATAGDAEVTLAWTAPSNKGDSDITKYEVSKDNGSTWTNAGLALTYTFTGLTNGTEYTFKVRAVNEQGSGTSTSKIARPAPSNLDGDLQYSWDYALSHLPAAFSMTYTIKMGDDESVRCKIIRTSLGYYMDFEDSPDTAYLYIKNGDKYDQYYYNDYDEMFLYNNVQVTQSSINTMLGTYLGAFMAPWSGASGFTKSGTQNVAGRSCDKYIFSFSANGIAFSYTCCIDKETNVCLKTTYAVAGVAGIEYTCTEFITTGVTLPSYEFKNNEKTLVQVKAKLEENGFYTSSITSWQGLSGSGLKVFSDAAKDNEVMQIHFYGTETLARECVEDDYEIYLSWLEDGWELYRDYKIVVAGTHEKITQYKQIFELT